MFKKMFLSVLIVAASFGQASPAFTATPGEIHEVVEKLAPIFSMDPSNAKALQNRQLQAKLVSYGDEALPVLKEYLAPSIKSTQKIIALYAIHGILKQASADYFYSTLQDTQRDVRTVAVYLLANCVRDQKKFDALKARLLAEPDRDIRILLMVALADYRNEEAKASIRLRLNDDDPYVQLQAKKLLELMDKPPAAAKASATQPAKKTSNIAPKK